MKNLGQILFDVLETYHAGSWQGSTAVKGNLLNGGVGLAPFHDFEAVIPDSIRTALTRIEEGIIDGSIDTGWK
jgi:basic membrane protein A and related proteins